MAPTANSSLNFDKERSVVSGHNSNNNRSKIIRHFPGGFVLDLGLEISSGFHILQCTHALSRILSLLSYSRRLHPGSGASLSTDPPPSRPPPPNIPPSAPYLAFAFRFS